MAYCCRRAASRSAPSSTSIWPRLYAKAGQNERALQYIRKALEEGFTERKKLMEDPEFATLRDLPEFKELLALEPRVL